MTNDFKPMSLESYNASNYCVISTSYFGWCLTFPDINYIIIWSYTNSYYANIYVQYGPATSQVTTTITARLWSNQRYMGTKTINISPTCWSQCRTYTNGGTVTLKTTAGNSNGLDWYLGKRKIEYYVSWTTVTAIPAGGSIVIVFPASVPKIYPHCRSMANLGSTLDAEGGSTNGEIGCMVQNTRQWVITGFNALPASSYVVIVGLIDLPNSNGYLGAGEIVTFNGTHASNIRSNGFIIDYYTHSNWVVNINNHLSYNVDS